MRNTTTRASLSLTMVLGLWLTGCLSRQADLNLPYPASPEPPSASAPNGATPQTTEANLSESRYEPVEFVVYVTTPQDVVARMLTLAQVRQTDVVYDLGCGDGRIVVAAAKTYGCHAVGVDLDPLRVKEATDSAEKNGVAHLVTVQLKDLFTVDLSQATVVALYLGTRLNRRLLPQLEQLAPGSRIVSHNYDIEGLTPDKVVRMTSREDGEDHFIYLWSCPLQRDSRR